MPNAQPPPQLAVVAPHGDLGSDGCLGHRPPVDLGGGRGEPAAGAPSGRVDPTAAMPAE